MAITQIIRSILSSALAPLLVFTLVACVVWLFKLRRFRAPWLWLSVAITTTVTAAAGAYLFLPVLFEDAETDIACVSALAMRGLPIYPSMADASRYILLYGPLTYLAHIPFYLLLGANLFAFKLLGVSALLASLIGIYRIARHYAASRDSLAGLGCASLVFFRYIGVEFWGRIDPLIIVTTVLAIWATVEGPAWVAVIVNALALATIPNLKISGFAYLLPILALLVSRKGWRVGSATVLIGALMLPLPFLLPTVSLTNYITVLRIAVGHGLVVNFFVRNIQYSILLLLPLLVNLRSVWISRPQLTYLLTIVSGLVITSILGSKSGAGSYHLLPFVVPILHLYFWNRCDLPLEQQDKAFASLAIAWALTTLFLASTHLQTVITTYRAAPFGKRIVAEIRRDEDEYQGSTIELGVGKDFEDPRTRYAYLPVFQNQPYTIAGAAIRDLQAGGTSIPEATIHRIENCGTRVWLIPKGDAPFSAQNSYYESPHPAFEQTFQDSFKNHYHRDGSGELFDVWRCK